MENKFSSPLSVLLNRLLQRHGGVFLILVLVGVQIFTTLLIAPIAALVQSNANLRVEQLSSTVIVTMLLALLSNAILLFVTLRMNRNAFYRLQEWKRQGKFSPNDPREKSAWSEITSLPWRYGVTSMVSSLVIVLLPLFIYQAFFLHLEIDQVMVRVDLVTDARKGVHLVGEFQDVLLLAETLGIDFEFDHDFVL